MNEVLRDEQKDISGFKSWDLITDVILYSPLAPIHSDDAQTDYMPENTEMIKYNYDKKEWLDVISLGESKLGHISDHSHSIAMSLKFMNLDTSYWRMKTLHHVLTFEQQMHKSIIDYDHIVEFGAGIGETARMILDRGFKGSYTILDLPQIGKISQYYTEGKTKLVTDINDLETEDHDPDRSLFIATWSLSEVPESLRWKIAAKIKGYDQLITFQRNFWHEYSIDNLAFFLGDWAYNTLTFQRYKDILFHTANNGNYYLIGKGLT